MEQGEIGATMRNWRDPHSHLYGLPMAVEQREEQQTREPVRGDWKSELAKAKTHEEQAALYRDLIGRRGGA
ncbi:hypothetical protein OH768_16670 [Streptomyces sp. NBC_01622]|uniref:hypothetical protein n=1 Tax=Streptomyces sp. NBC_01622 TaxID=2975903 RepID=UPI003864033E|nr:hypothetical protein OH768_16670 [Streptomyces sp. NBC_01622]